MAVRARRLVRLGAALTALLSACASIAADKSATPSPGASQLAVNASYAERLAEFQITPAPIIDAWYIPINENVRVLFLSDSGDQWLVAATNFATDVDRMTSISIAQINRDQGSPLFRVSKNSDVTSIESVVIVKSSPLSQSQFSTIRDDLGVQRIQLASPTDATADAVYPVACSDGAAYFIETLFDKQRKILSRTSCDASFFELSPALAGLLEIAGAEIPDLAAEIQSVKAKYLGNPSELVQ